MIAIRKILKRQRGLSLLWCAVLMALLTIGALLVLFSLRYERNFLAEIWTRATQSGTVAGALQKTRSVATGAKPATIRRCMVDGVVLYSNVDCDLKKSGSKAVKLNLPQGFEASKAPAAPVAAELPEQRFPQ